MPRFRFRSPWACCCAVILSVSFPNRSVWRSMNNASSRSLGLRSGCPSRKSRPAGGQRPIPSLATTPKLAASSAGVGGPAPETPGGENQQRRAHQQEAGRLGRLDVSLSGGVPPGPFTSTVKADPSVSSLVKRALNDESHMKKAKVLLPAVELGLFTASPPKCKVKAMVLPNSTF